MKEESIITINQLEALNHQLEQAIKQALITGRREDLEKAQRLKSQMAQSLNDFKENLKPKPKTFTPEQKKGLEQANFKIFTLTGKSPNDYKEEGKQIIFPMSNMTEQKILDHKSQFSEVAISDLNQMGIMKTPNSSFTDQSAFVSGLANTDTMQSLNLTCSIGSAADYIDLYFNADIKYGDLFYRTINPNSVPGSLVINFLDNMISLSFEDQDKRSNRIGIFPLCFPNQ